VYRQVRDAIRQRIDQELLAAGATSSLEPSSMSGTL
jgi:hypothetical protein